MTSRRTLATLVGALTAVALVVAGVHHWVFRWQEREPGPARGLTPSGAGAAPVSMGASSMVEPDGADGARNDGERVPRAADTTDSQLNGDSGAQREASLLATFERKYADMDRHELEVAAYGLKRRYEAAALDLLSARHADGRVQRERVPVGAKHSLPAGQGPVSFSAKYSAPGADGACDVELAVIEPHDDSALAVLAIEIEWVARRIADR